MPNATQSLFDGAWTFYVDPRAVYYSNANQRTYFGWVDTGGTVRVTHYDHATGNVPAPVAMRTFANPDDHDNPSFLVRDWDDDRLLVFYCHHNDTQMRLRISRVAEDASAFGPEFWLQSQIQGEARLPGGPDFSYPQPFYLADEDKIYLFFRNYPITGYSTSADGGTTWTTETVIFEDGDQRPYIKCIQYGTGRVLFAVNAGHPNETDGNCTLHFCYYEAGGWYNVRGGNVGALPLTPRTDLEMVSAAHTWIWDIATEADGTPRLLYTEYPRGAIEPNAQLLRHARWNGRKWDISTVVAPGPGPVLTTGEAYYSGAGTFDKANPDDIYLARRVQPQNKIEIFRYTTTNRGRTWQEAKQYTFDSADHSQRPYVVLHGRDDFKFMYFTGDYPNYLAYDTVVRWSAK